MVENRHNEKNGIIQFPFSWESFQNIGEILAPFFDDEELHGATTMVSTELLENAVKYGAPLPDYNGIKFYYAISTEKITITVACLVIDEYNRNKAIDYIRQIRDAEDVYALYMARFNEILVKGGGKSGGLGFYRIAAEAGFTLGYSQNGAVFTVIAERSLS